MARGAPPVNPKGNAMREGHGQDARATNSASGAALGGTGVPPVDHGPKEQDSDSQVVTIRRGAYLPHWTREGAIYAVTFRLYDSIPQNTIRTWRLEAETALKAAARSGQKMDDGQRKSLAGLQSEKVEQWLDSGYGCCVLRDDRVAKFVAEALKHFDGDRYTLFVWCIMPNHVHTLLRPLRDHRLPDILHSWKSYTAKVVNKHLDRRGELWQPEYYDRSIRDEDEFRRQIRYILGNPATAGLSDWKWVGLGQGTATE